MGRPRPGRRRPGRAMEPGRGRGGPGRDGGGPGRRGRGWGRGGASIRRRCRGRSRCCWRAASLLPRPPPARAPGRARPVQPHGLRRLGGCCAPHGRSRCRPLQLQRAAAAARAGHGRHQRGPVCRGGRPGLAGRPRPGGRRRRVGLHPGRLHVRGPHWGGGAVREGRGGRAGDPGRGGGGGGGGSARGSGGGRRWR
jgi:hypothetical protein